MWLFDLFNIKKMKQELEALRKIKATQDELMYIDLKDEINQLNQVKERLQDQKTQMIEEIPILSSISNLYEQKINLESDCLSLENKKDALKSEIVNLEDRISLQNFGCYQYRYNMENSQLYLNHLKEIESRQKYLIKHKLATNHSLEWIMCGDTKKGKTFILNSITLCLRAFNTEADNIIFNVKFNNVDKCADLIRKKYNEINDLVKMQSISITNEYLNLKLEQLYLKHEYELKKQQERIEQEEIKERIREEAKAQKEIEEMQRKLDKEQFHYEKALEELESKIIASNNDMEKSKLHRKIKEVKSRLNDISDNQKTIEERLLNTRAGYVYIISNIGSFGENVYKIGMTRRLNPLDRVNELGDASVPFKFDVHAMIFSEDAPALEHKLHTYFRNREVNKVNHRKEFFYVSLDEIEKVVKEVFDKPVEFIKTALAQEYRQSLSSQ